VNSQPFGLIGTIIQRLDQAIESVLSAPATLVDTVEGVIALILAPLPGDPGQLRTLAAAFSDAASTVNPIGTDLAKLSGHLNGAWQGTTGWTASEVVADVGSQMLIDVQRPFTATASAINTYANTLSQLESRRGVLAQQLRTALSNMPKSGSTLLDYVGELYPWAQWAERVASIIQGLITVYQQLEEAANVLAENFGVSADDGKITTMSVRAFDGLGAAVEVTDDGVNQSVLTAVGVGIGGSIAATGGPAATSYEAGWQERFSIGLGPYFSVNYQDTLPDNGNGQQIVQGTATGRIPFTDLSFRAGEAATVSPDGTVSDVHSTPPQNRYSWGPEASITRYTVSPIGTTTGDNNFGLSSDNWGDSSALTRLAPPAAPALSQPGTVTLDDGQAQQASQQASQYVQQASEQASQYVQQASQTAQQQLQQTSQAAQQQLQQTTQAAQQQFQQASQ
jgi:hypothetical protein